MQGITKLEKRKIMNIKYINATNAEKCLIEKVLQFIKRRFPNQYDYKLLHYIKIEDELANNSSAQTREHTIIISRKNGISDVYFEEKEILESHIYKDKKLHVVVSTIYHELWHVNTWKKYQKLYDYVLDESSDIIKALAYRYWIEYVSHIETVCLEEEGCMKQFCLGFVNTRWAKIECGYQEMLINLPYFLCRAHYLGIYANCLNQIESNIILEIVKSINDITEELLNNQIMSESEKANVIYKEFQKIYQN